MNNLIIRKALEHCNLRQWEGAEANNISEWTFCRKLRSELPMGEQEAMARNIFKYAEEKKNAFTRDENNA